MESHYCDTVLNMTGLCWDRLYRQGDLDTNINKNNFFSSIFRYDILII